MTFLVPSTAVLAAVTATDAVASPTPCIATAVNARSGDDTHRGNCVFVGADVSKGVVIVIPNILRVRLMSPPVALSLLRMCRLSLYHVPEKYELDPQAPWDTIQVVAYQVLHHRETRQAPGMYSHIGPTGKSSTK